MMSRGLVVLVLGWIVSLSLALGVAGYYYMQYRSYADLLQQYEPLVIRVNICIDYGNGTVTWYNNTLVPINYSLLNATMMIASVEYTYWPKYNACFVDSINGVPNRDPYYWMWWYWDEGERAWKHGLVSADHHILKQGEIVMWRYEKPSW